MQDFVTNAGANLVGTFVGAALALLSAWWVRQRDRRASDRRELQSLITRLHRMRALVPVEDTRPRDTTGEFREDFARCNSSVLAARDRAAAVCDGLASSRGYAIADRFVGHCLDYLDGVDLDPDNYVALLMVLRARAFDVVRELVAALPELQPLEPGRARLAGSSD